MSALGLLRQHLTYANVAATLAVVIALSGTAYAAGVAKNSVTSKSIKNGQVRSVDLKNDGVTGTDVNESSLARVPDAERLGGVPAGSLKTVTVPVTAAGTQGTGATAFYDEVDLGSSQDGTVSWTLLLPADRVPGEEITAELLYQEGSNAACSWVASTGGVIESEGGFANSAWVVPGGNSFSGPISLVAGDVDAHRATFRFATSSLGPGALATFTVTRQGGNVADTCQTVRIRGLQFHY